MKMKKCFGQKYPMPALTLPPASSLPTKKRRKYKILNIRLNPLLLISHLSKNDF